MVIVKSLGQKKKFLGQKLFDGIFVEQKFDQKIFFSVKIFFGQKLFFGQNIFLVVHAHARARTQAHAHANMCTHTSLISR